MKNVTRLSAFGLMALALVLFAVGVVNLQKANAGLASLDAVYEAQNVTLSYDEDGELLDRGTTEEADAIVSMHALATELKERLGSIPTNVGLLQQAGESPAGKAEEGKAGDEGDETRARLRVARGQVVGHESSPIGDDPIRIIVLRSSMI